jgi:hypothetical protein
MATGNAINANSTGLVRYDGSGTFSGVTVTQHDLLIGAASNGITSLALTDGQLAIGSTGNDPSAATLTAGTGVNITSASGAITISAVGSGLTWSTITANQTAAINNGYICNKAGTLVLTLPGTAAVGSVIAAANINTTNGTQFLSANPGQLVFGTSSATANTGTLTSTHLGDVMYLVCVVANTTWYVFGTQGNWTVA